MSLTKICERCDMEMRLIPAGVSKSSGKAYSAFWSCDKRNGGCGATASAAAGEAGPIKNSNSKLGSGVNSDFDQNRLNSIESKIDRILALLEK